MYNKAVDKIRDEMAKASDAVCMVGEIVTLYLQSDPANAEKILAEGKTLEGAYAAMRNYARQKRMECMTPDQASARIADYYDMETKKMMDMHQAVKESVPDETTKPQARAEAEDLDLDALLGM